MVKLWNQLAREVVYKKFSRTIEKVDFQMPDDSVSDFYIKQEGPAVAVVALTPENRVILVKQFRPGPQKIMKELPGGFIDQGETPLEAGERELLEETGYSGEVQFIGESWDDAYSTMHRSILVARNCIKKQSQKLDKDEYVEVVLITLDEFRSLLRSGEMTDVEVGYIALDHLNLL